MQPIEPRKVIHIDCDCFFAAVEMRDNSALREIPLAIGSPSERRGVISTCNYPARKFGVRSAMATAYAYKLCPQLTLLPGRMSVYADISKQIMHILAQYALVLEQVSVDEAYLEIAPSENATQIAANIRKRIEQEIGITVSAGIAPNKFLAKIASDWNKPNGQWVIKPDMVHNFLTELPLTKINGIGPAQAKRLALYNLHTCGDVRAWKLTELVRLFGRTGALLFERSRGIDHRLVSNDYVRKSVSVERTYSSDLSSIDACMEQLPDLWDRWVNRVEKDGFDYSALAPFVKVKFADFTQTTLADIQERASPEGFKRLLMQALHRQAKAVRLLGIGGRLPDIDKQQLVLF